MKPTTAGYSGTSLINKLGIKPTMKILLLNQPDNYYDLLATNISDQQVQEMEIPDLV